MAGRQSWSISSIMISNISLVCVQASKRMDQLEFDPRIEYSAHAIHIGHYACPMCNAVVEFNTNHFQKHFAQPYSNLAPEIAALMDQFRPCDLHKYESFIDFYCPTCASPVRLIYEGWEFAMGCYGFTVTDIIEKVS